MNRQGKSKQRRGNRRGSDSKKVANMNSRKDTRSNSSKDERRLKEAEDSLVHVSGTNEFSWYSKFPQFTKDAGTLAFGIPLGQPINLTPTDKIAIPGIMAIYYLPGVGYSQDLSSPINRMAMRFYTYLRDVQKAAAKYDGADVMMYLMAVDSLICFHALMRRAYGVAQLYTPVNKYYPRRLLQYMGFDPSIANNLAEFRAYINRFAIAIGSYCMPKDFDICVRHKWMNSGLYLDSNTTRAQTYFFVPEGFYQFNNTVTTGSQLDLNRWTNNGAALNNLHTLEQVQAFGDAMLNAILGDQDTGNISGDLYSAYTKSGKELMTLEETPDGYSVEPVYNARVLSQIENATLCGELVGSTVISQDPSVNNGAIKFSPSFNFGGMSGTTANTFVCPVRNYAPINMHVDSPTPEDVIEATRLSVCFKVIPGFEDTAQFFPDVFGSDIVTRVQIGVTNPETNALSSIYSNTNYVVYSSMSTVQQMTNRLQFVALSESFDWSPMLWLYTVGTGNSVDVTQPAFDADNLTVASTTQLAMMHEASLLSMLDVPQMGM